MAAFKVLASMFAMLFLLFSAAAATAHSYSRQYHSGSFPHIEPSYSTNAHGHRNGIHGEHHGNYHVGSYECGECSKSDSWIPAAAAAAAADASAVIVVPPHSAYPPCSGKSSVVYTSTTTSTATYLLNGQDNVYCKTCPCSRVSCHAHA